MYRINAYEYLINSAERDGERLAFTDGEKDYSFSALRAAAEAMGSAIAEKFGATSRPIAVSAERTADTVAALQGVLASGNYYVPIDPAMPRARMEEIFRTVRPLCLLVPEGSADKFPSDCARITFEEGFAHGHDRALTESARAKVIDVDPAYMIFTSGSTGKPKGIVIPHRALIDFTEWMSATFGFTHDDVFANQAPFYFDLSVKDLYQTLRCGASCHIMQKKYFLFPKMLLDYAKEHGVTAFVWATSAFRLVANSGALARSAPDCLRKVIVGGEAMQAKHLNAWRAALPRVEYVNLYGPTEVTVDCTYYKIDRGYSDEEVIPIGRACENKQVMLLDENLLPVPRGQVGEICVRGSGLAKGYYADSEKTAAAFVQNPASPYPDIIYRTGDLATEGDDGLLYFRSRTDGQIKHMGYRIEYGEIEAALASIDGVDEGICLFDEARDLITAYYSGTCESGVITRALAALIPKYMIPGKLIRLDCLPHNANGKIDRVSLQERYKNGKDN